MEKRKQMTKDIGIASRITRDLNSKIGAAAQIKVVEGGFRVEGLDTLHGRWSVLPPDMQAKWYRALSTVVQVEGQSGTIYDVVVYSGF